MPPRQRRVGTGKTTIKHILYFIATVFLLLVFSVVLKMRTKAINQFVAYSNWTLFVHPPPVIILGEEDVCAETCVRTAWCKAFVFDHFMPLPLCRAYAHTPFYHDVQPIPLPLSTIYIKGDAEEPGERRPDGFLYYVSEAPMAAATATRYCEEDSEFYFLATETAESSALKWAKEVYLELLQKYGGNGYGIFILEHQPAKVQVEKNMLGRKDLVMVTDTITRDVPESTLGYALCQGDPINLLGSPTYYRNVIYPNHTEKDFTQRIRKSKLSRPKIAMAFEPVKAFALDEAFRSLSLRNSHGRAHWKIINP